MNLVSDTATKFSRKEYFAYPVANKNVKGILQLEDFNNNLVFNGNIGELHFNLIYNGLRIDKILTYFKCNKMYFRIGGEHTIDGNKKYDLELQFSCEGRPKGSQEDWFLMVAIPASIVKEGESQDKFFDNFAHIKADVDKFPLNMNIESFHDVFNGFSMNNKVFYYLAGKNFPPCTIEGYRWLFIDNPSRINQATFDNLKSLFKDSIPKEGNYRESSDRPTEPSDTNILYLIEP